MTSIVENLSMYTRNIMGVQDVAFRYVPKIYVVTPWQDDNLQLPYVWFNTTTKQWCAPSDVSFTSGENKEAFLEFMAQIVTRLNEDHPEGMPVQYRGDMHDNERCFNKDMRQIERSKK